MTTADPCSHWSGGRYCGLSPATRFMNGWFCDWHTPDSKGANLMTLPAWLTQRLGKPTRGRGAVAAKCIVCKAPILIGMSEDVAAVRALVDPNPLSPLGEALARIDGRKTYRLGKYDEGLAFWERTHWQIESQKASSEIWVLADHRCGGAKFPAVEIPVLSAPMKQPVSDDNEPPF